MSIVVESLDVGEYRLVPLTTARQDAVSTFLGKSKGVYICNCPEPAWYEKFGFRRTVNAGTERKKRMFTEMATGSTWLSMTDDGIYHGETIDWQSSSGIYHIGNGGYRGRLAQLYQAARLMSLLLRRSENYDYSYVYNFDLPQLLVPWLLRVISSTPIIVDYEDDYTLHGGSAVKRVIETWARRHVNGVVCINESMQEKLKAIPSCTSNTFADLRYTNQRKFELRDGMSLLFASRLDDVRGADMLLDLSRSIRDAMLKIKVQVVGTGPLASWVESLNVPEIDYLGFLNDEDYQKILDETDGCLVLQRPDHPFSRGSYPSKIEWYARYHKPIWKLAQRSHD